MSLNRSTDASDRVLDLKKLSNSKNNKAFNLYKYNNTLGVV